MLRLRHGIDTHKTLTPFVILSLMYYHNSWGMTSYIYLALHASYCISWLYKSSVYPDRQFEKEASIGTFFFTLIVTALYWIAPYIITVYHVDAPPLIACLAISSYALGLVAHFGSDAQKFFVLAQRPGLITDGFFAATRNPNYLGEVALYVGFSALSMSWIPFAILMSMFLLVFLPGMLKKDKSLSRYPEFEMYKQNTFLILPKLWGRRPMNGGGGDKPEETPLVQS